MLPAAVLCTIDVNVTDNGNEHVTAITSMDFMGGDFLLTTLDVPLELLTMFVNEEGPMTLTVTSSLFINLRALFPDGLPTRNE